MKRSRRNLLKSSFALFAAAVLPETLAKTLDKSTISADTLELPEGLDWCLRIDGMREIRAYDIALDVFVMRWDTMINGHQVTHFDYETKTQAMVEALNGEETSPLNLGRVPRAKARKIFERIANRTTIV